MLPPHTVDGPAGAPPLVLCNSLGTTWNMWTPQVPVLTQRFRLVRYEQRGHGGASVPPEPWSIDDLGGDLVELLDHLGLARASLCGVSLGGMVAMWVAARHPQRVDRLVLACTSARFAPASAWTERASTVRKAGTAVLLDTLMGRWFTPASASRFGASTAEMLAAVDPGGYAACCEAIGSADLRSELGQITAPTLVVCGAEDPVVPPPSAVDLQQAVAGSGLIVLPDAAHLANLEQPEAFTAAVVDHVAGRAWERGDAVRRAVLGDVHVDRPTGPFRAPFTDLATRLAWGEVWTRPGLDRATRSCITLAMLVALGRWEELELHARGALRNGVTAEQIGEVLLQAAVYSGLPAANTAFRVVERVINGDHDGT